MANVKRPRICRRGERRPGDDYTKTELSQELRLSRSTLDEFVSLGILGCQKYGKVVRFTPSQVAEFRLLHEKQISREARQELIAIILRHFDEMADVLNLQRERVA